MKLTVHRDSELCHLPLGMVSALLQREVAAEHRFQNLGGQLKCPMASSILEYPAPWAAQLEAWLVVIQH